MSALAGEPAFETEQVQSRLAGLRQMLAEKFPQAEQKPGGIFPTRLAAVDGLEGGLRRAAVTELSGSPGAGALFLHEMLRAVCREQCFAALVDAGRTFEPGGCAAPVLARLLVVFCADAAQSMKAVDLLLRDGNLSLILLDLQGVPAAQLRRIPANTWHRFQRLAEQTTSALVVLTRQPTVESARVRIATGGRWTLAAQRRWRSELIAGMPMRVFPRHGGEKEGPPVDADGRRFLVVGGGGEREETAEHVARRGESEDVGRRGSGGGKIAARGNGEGLIHERHEIRIRETREKSARLGHTLREGGAGNDLLSA